ncbi:MAG: type VI secretion system ImpA family N-terminal domain-containing protein [Nocardioides sp.]
MTAEEILKLAEPWTAPISDSAPSGVSAKEDERYLSVTTEIAKLDSPTTEKIEWKKVWSAVISQGGELLQEKSKDILVASQVAYAFFRQDGLKGLLTGVALLTALIENFWPTLYPELKRLKGRAAAVQWFLDKSDIQLKAYKPVPGDRDTLDSLVVVLKRFNASARDKYGDATPSIGKLREMIERLVFDAGPSQAELDAAKAEEDAKQKAAADERARADAAKAQAAAQAATTAAQAPAQPAAPAAPPPVAPPVAPPPVAPPPVAQPAAPPPPVYTGPPPTVAAPTATAGPPPADVSQVNSVEAGLAFDAAVSRVARDTHGPLAQEFVRTLQEMQIGVSRGEAMRAMAERTTMKDLKSFCLAMVQADSFGIPIARVLRVQAQEMRVKRRQRAEEKAQKLPVKILFPLIFFILPCLFIVILGPAVLAWLDFASRQ